MPLPASTEDFAETRLELFMGDFLRNGAVDEGLRREIEANLRRLEEAHRRIHVCVVRAPRIDERPRNARQRGEVKDAVGAVERGLEDVGLHDVAADEPELGEAPPCFVEREMTDELYEVLCDFIRQESSVADSMPAAEPKARFDRLVDPYDASADLTARAIATRLADNLKQSVVIENKPGAGGVVAGDLVAKAQPDGHTLFLMSNGTAVSAGLFQSLPFDAQKDFAPVVTLGFFDIAVLAAANSRFRSMQ